MTTENLTEQWKKGELESGYYFFKTKDNIKIGFLYEGFKYPYDGRYNTIEDVEVNNELAIYYIDGNIIEEWKDNGDTTAIFNSTMILSEDWEIV